jgi:hypothetical protein
LHSTGVYQFPKSIEKINRWAAFWWLVGLLGGWFQCLHLYRNLQIKAGILKKAIASDNADLKEESKRSLRSLENERSKVIRDWMICSADILIPSNTLGYIPTNLGVVGLAGTFSSILGGLANWPQ